MIVNVPSIENCIFHRKNIIRAWCKISIIFLILWYNNILCQICFLFYIFVSRVYLHKSYEAIKRFNINDKDLFISFICWEDFWSIFLFSFNIFLLYATDNIRETHTHSKNWTICIELIQYLIISMQLKNVQVTYFLSSFSLKKNLYQTVNFYFS